MTLILLMNVSLIGKDLVEGESKKKVPFELDEGKKLDESELKEKKEGSYITALPYFSYDEVRGMGMGLRGNYFYNGNKSNPLFEYQPYVYKLTTQMFKTTKNAESYSLSFDAPYLFNTQYRIKTSLSYDRNQSSQYFGTGEKSMRRLSYRPRNDPNEQIRSNAKYHEVESSREYSRTSNPARIYPEENDKNYNAYDFQSTTFGFMLDRTFWKALRWYGSPEFSGNTIRTFDYPQNGYSGKNDKLSTVKNAQTGLSYSVPNGKSKLTEDCESGKIRGCRGGYVNYLRFGIMYDTRDFEPDPDSGLVLEANYSLIRKWAGSDYNFEKILLQSKIFYMPFPKIFEELVLAGRGAVHWTKGDAPFYELRYVWTYDGSFTGLGGLNTIRGYRQDRFSGAVLGFANLEIRWRFATWKKGDQLFTFSLVPFYDVGRVWDKPDRMNLQGYAGSFGIGLRAIWNQATVILVDIAKSREETQVYWDFSHIF